MAMLNPCHPGEIPRDNLEAANLSVTEAASRLGCTRQALSRLLNGKAGISPTMALALTGSARLHLDEVSITLQDRDTPRRNLLEPGNWPSTGGSTRCGHAFPTRRLPSSSGQARIVWGNLLHVASVYCHGGLDEKMDAGTEFTPQGSIEGISARALAHVSRLLNRPIETALDLAEVTRKGVSPELMTVLVDSGFTRREVDWIVPPRTLSHRRQNGRPLTANETGCFLRAVKIRAMAEAVLGNSEMALAWLRKPRRSFGGISAMELLQTEAGGQVVEEFLGQLDEGHFA